MRSPSKKFEAPYLQRAYQHEPGHVSALLKAYLALRRTAGPAWAARLVRAGYAAGHENLKAHQFAKAPQSTPGKALHRTCVNLRRSW